VTAIRGITSPRPRLCSDASVCRIETPGAQSQPGGGLHGCTHQLNARMGHAARGPSAARWRGRANRTRPSEAYGATIRPRKRGVCPGRLRGPIRAQPARSTARPSGPKNLASRTERASVFVGAAKRKSAARPPTIARTVVRPQAVAWRARGWPAPALFLRQGRPGAGCPGRTRLLLRGVVPRFGCRGACRAEPSVHGNS
jgi:hypothetical protein